MQRKNLSNFNSPHGQIRNLEVETRPDRSDLLYPYPNHPDPQMRGLHHHLYWDSKRENTIGLAYTCCDEQGKAWREYYIDRGADWELLDRTDSYNSLKEMNQAFQAKRDIKAAERFSQYLAVRLAICELDREQPERNVTPEIGDSYFNRY